MYKSRNSCLTLQTAHLPSGWGQIAYNLLYIMQKNKKNKKKAQVKNGGGSTLISQNQRTGKIAVCQTKHFHENSVWSAIMPVTFRNVT